METHDRIFIDHLVHNTIRRFIEVWPDATVHDLARAMPAILSEAARYQHAKMPARQAAYNIVWLLSDNSIIPPWVDVSANKPSDALESA